MANKDDKYIAEVMAQKKELGIDCPAIDHIEIVEISGIKEETDMANDKIMELVFEQDCLRLLGFVERINEVILDFYDVYDQPNKSAAEKRYLLRKEGQINGMCEAFEILFHTRIEWGREGIKKMRIEEGK